MELLCFFVYQFLLEWPILQLSNSSVDIKKCRAHHYNSCRAAMVIDKLKLVENKIGVFNLFMLLIYN